MKLNNICPFFSILSSGNFHFYILHATKSKICENICLPYGQYRRKRSHDQNLGVHINIL